MEPGREDYATRYTLFILCTINLASLVTTYPMFVIYYDKNGNTSCSAEQNKREHNFVYHTFSLDS